MQIDESKLARQQQGADKWWTTWRGTLNYIMRFGKTYTAILIIKRIFKIAELHKDSIDDKYKVNILILTPSITVKEVWLTTLADNNITDRFEVLTAQEFLNTYNLDNKYKCTVFIPDEVHKFLSDERYKIFEYIDYKGILALTGTYPSGKDKVKLDKYCPVIDSITESEALTNNWIAPFIEYNLALELNSTDKERYERLSIPIKETLQLFKKSYLLLPNELNIKDDYSVITACYSGWNYNKIHIPAPNIREKIAEKKGWSKGMTISNDFTQQINDYWSPEHIFDRVKSFTNIVRTRNDIINNNAIKLDAVVEIYRIFQCTTICFNESTDFADRVEEAINHNFNNIAICYHSNIESKPMKGEDGFFVEYKSGIKKGQPKMYGKDVLRTMAIDGIRENKYKFLSTARALDEGLDIPNIELVITTAGTTNPMQYKQRNARGKTVDIYNKDKITIIVNLYFDDFYNSNGDNVVSRDKSKLHLRQADSRHNIIEISSIEQLRQSQLSD